MKSHQFWFKKFSHIVLITVVLSAGVLWFAKNESYFDKWLGRAKTVPVRQVLDIPVEKSTFVAAPSPSGDLKEIPIFVYHGVIPRIEQASDDLNVTSEVFRSQLKMLKENGYETIDTLDLLQYVTSGVDNLPAKPVMITFDDGRIDTIKGGDPILREFGFKAVLFDVVGKQNRSDKFFLSWDDLRVAHQSGRWDIQLHAGDHFHESMTIDAQGSRGYFASNKQWLAEKNRVETEEEFRSRLSADILQGKTDLERNLPDLKVVAFAYPYGDYGQNTLNVDKERAVQINRDIIDPLFPLSFGFNVREGGSGFMFNKSKDAHLITRLVVSDSFSAENLKYNLEKFNKRSLPFIINTFGKPNADDIGEIWGNAEMLDGKLVLNAETNATGAEVMINGTETWQSYQVSADVKILNGQTGFVMGRYQNERNFLMCGVDGNNLSLRQMVFGNNTLIKFLPLNRARTETLRITLDVDGTQVKCSIDGQEVGPYSIPPNLSNGGVGFKTWDPQNAQAKMEVYNLRVEK